MKFYKENNVNPFASCLPLAAQLPVFISLFYMLRTDLRPTSVRRRPGRLGTRPGQHSARRPCGPHIRREVPVHPRHHRQGDRRRADRADRALRRHPARLDLMMSSPTMDKNQRRMMLSCRSSSWSHRQLPGRPARVLDHHEHVDDRPAVLDQEGIGAPPPAAARAATPAERLVATGRTASRRPARAKPRPRAEGGARRREPRPPAASQEKAAGEGAWQRRPRRTRPAAPPRKKKKRSGPEAMSEGGRDERGCRRGVRGAARADRADSASTRRSRSSRSRRRAHGESRRRRPRAADRPPRPDDRRDPAPRLPHRLPRRARAASASWSTPPATASGARRRCAPTPTRRPRPRCDTGGRSRSTR